MVVKRGKIRTAIADRMWCGSLPTLRSPATLRVDRETVEVIAKCRANILFALMYELS